MSALHAELLKLGTLPALRWAFLATGGLTAVAVAGRAAEVTGFAQVGLVLLGVVAGTADATGGPARTVLLAVPGRVRLALTRTAVLGSAALAGSAAGLLDSPAAMVRLAATGLLAGAVGTVTGSAPVALTTLLGWLLIGAPLLRGGGTPWTGVLPGVASGGRGAAVLLGWAAVATTAAVLTTVLRDAGAGPRTPWPRHRTR
jgi:hypothetical protein